MTETPTVGDLVEQWEAAGRRTLLAQHGHGDEHPADHWTKLKLGALIVAEVQSGRWPTVAALLRLGAVESWAQVAEALGVSGVEAHDGFTGWVGRQVEFGWLAAAEAGALYELAEAVT